MYLDLLRRFKLQSLGGAYHALVIVDGFSGLTDVHTPLDEQSMTENLKKVHDLNQMYTSTAAVISRQVAHVAEHGLRSTDAVLDVMLILCQSDGT